MKTHLTHCISIVILSIIISACAKENEYSNADWIYLNESKYEITIQYGIDPSSCDGYEKNFILNPNAKHIIEIRYDLGFPNMQAPDFICPYREGARITINHRVFELRSPNSIAHIINYQSRKLGYNYYQFTYTFTDEYIEELLKSKQEQE